MTPSSTRAYRNSEFFEEDSASDHISHNEQVEITANAERIVDNPYLLIPLTQGQFAKVSPHRFEELNAFKWFAYWSKCTNSFYAVRNIPLCKGRQTNVKMHRVILGLKRGDKREGDHWNRDTLDNRDDNLRIATKPQNMQNRRIQKSNTSGFKGVNYHPKTGKWMARIAVEGERLYLGLFETSALAHAAYCDAAARLHGAFARTS